MIAQSLKEKLENMQRKNPDGDILIAISLSASEKAIALILAISKLGGSYIPIDYLQPEGLMLQVGLYY